MAADVLHDARAELRPDATARSAELLQTELDRFETLLVDLLEISRFDAGAARARRSTTSTCVDIVHRVVEATKPLADQRGVRVRRRGAGPRLPGRGRPAPGRADRAQPDHQRDRPRRGRRRRSGSWSRLDSDDHAAAIAVRDYGVGLGPGEAAMVFNRFWRADPARARTSGGTGLGLSIALEDAHLHGGWLQAWGRPGQGAQFRLTLPRRAGEPLRHSPLPLVPLDADERVASRRPPSREHHDDPHEVPRRRRAGASLALALLVSRAASGCRTRARCTRATPPRTPRRPGHRRSTPSPPRPQAPPADIVKGS